MIAAGDDEIGLGRSLQNHPGIALLDLNLPQLSAIEVSRRVRRTTEVDRVVGLELGADDSISKPFSPREVVARESGGW